MDLQYRCLEQVRSFEVWLTVYLYVAANEVAGVTNMAATARIN